MNQVRWLVRVHVSVKCFCSYRMGTTPHHEHRLCEYSCAAQSLPWLLGERSDLPSVRRVRDDLANISDLMSMRAIGKIGVQTVHGVIPLGFAHTSAYADTDLSTDAFAISAEGANASTDCNQFCVQGRTGHSSG